MRVEQKLYESLRNPNLNLKINQEQANLLDEIQKNLKHRFYPWQKEALENFLLFENHSKKDDRPTHLMFNMATGSGKTLVMAALILYYYQQGYRRFIFFVNRTNIVDKTENNFIDLCHNKYLFENPVVLRNQRINFKKVDTFSSYPTSVEIKFTTIQQIYNDINFEKENKITFEDFRREKIVMLADEAHHLNVDTKKNQGRLGFNQKLSDRTPKDIKEIKGWEQTVLEIKKQNKDNVLLEFTATIPDQAKKKYQNKVVAEFKLPDFMMTGYTKVVKLIYSSLDRKQRILLALIMNWQRHQVALKAGIPNFKPVILFRSKTINQSRQDYQEFLTIIKNLNPKDFGFIKKISDKLPNRLNFNQFSGSKLEQILATYLVEEQKANFYNLIIYLKNNFKENNLIITNSKTNKNKTKEKTTQEQESQLNSLEDKDNPIQAIFTVERLTEGWDVLNLFDIVRLYSGQDAGKHKSGRPKPGKATIAEKQLIGRGVRYFPFDYPDKLRTKRKFDNDLSNQLRSLEELYFHSDNEHRYINVLKQELREAGYLEPQPDKEPIVFRPKQTSFYQDFYNRAVVWINQQIDNPNLKTETLKSIKQAYLDRTLFSHHDDTGLNIVEDEVFQSRKNIVSAEKVRNISISVSQIDRHIFRKAINQKAQAANSLFRFSQLKDELEIESIDDLQQVEVFGDLKIDLKTNKPDFTAVDNHQKLKIALKFLSVIELIVKTQKKPKLGSDFKKIEFLEQFDQPKEKLINVAKIQESSFAEYDWYVLNRFVGTSEEKAFLEFISQQIHNLKKDDQYDVYLVRNEEVYKIFNFSDGKGFQPDFLLFLINKKPAGLNYQILIEPKGSHVIEKDRWKENFLNEIFQRYGRQSVLKANNQDYSLIGLPFYSQEKELEFKKPWSERVINRL